MLDVKANAVYRQHIGVHARYRACRASSLAWYSSSVFGANGLGGLNKFSRFHVPIRNDHDPQPFCPGSDSPSPTPSSRLPDCGTPQNHAPFTNQLPSGSRTPS